MYHYASITKLVSHLQCFKKSLKFKTMCDARALSVQE